MSEMPEPVAGAFDARSATRRDVVVVPHRPGALFPLDRSAARGGPDDLDVLIDDLFPDTDEGPGSFDIALLVVGAGLLGWALLGNGPAAVGVAGGVALFLGTILPMRALWRRLQSVRKRRRHNQVLKLGVPLQTGHPAVNRLVDAYETLVQLRGWDIAMVGAAHGAVVEVATLLHGRAPGLASEGAYVDKRAAAIERLVAAVRVKDDEAGFTGRNDEGPLLDPEAVVQAREELDAIAGMGSLSQLDDLTAEARARARRS